MTRAGNKNEIESSEGGEGKPGPKAIWNDRVSKSGKKIGCKRAYASVEAKLEDRRRRQRESARKRRAKQRGETLGKEGSCQKDGKDIRVYDRNKEMEGGRKVEECNEGGGGERDDIGDDENNGGSLDFGDNNDPIDVDTDDPEKIRSNGQLDMRRAEQGEYEFQEIEQFGTIVDVAYDGNCGYLSFIGALKYVKKKCREDVGEFRRDIRNYVENHKNKDKFAFVRKQDLDAIFQEELEYTGEVDTAHWMEGSLVGAVVADLFNVVVYIYSEKKKDRKKIKRGEGKETRR